MNIVLDVVRDKSFPDYVLLLGHGGYQSENEGTFLSPYVISCPLEMYQDRTRERFLVSLEIPLQTDPSFRLKVTPTS